MKHLLIDVDSTMPNLALMQTSSYLKRKGHEVGFKVQDPDEVWISCIFRENREQALGTATFYPHADIHFGGSGINLHTKLPEAEQKVKPDYNLYEGRVCQGCGKLISYCKCIGGPTRGDMWYSLGFTSRGCIRSCPFCIVPEKEGTFHRWLHPRELYDERFDTMVLLDNNLTADSKWFFEVTDWILDQGLKWDPNQGLDIRLLTLEMAVRLKELKIRKNRFYHFAFDNLRDEQAVRRGIALMKKAGLDVRHNVEFYVLVGHSTTEEEDLYRCNLLRDLGTNAFVMPYVKTKWTRKLSRWANRKWVFWGVDFENYDHAKQGRVVRG